MKAIGYILLGIGVCLMAAGSLVMSGRRPV